MYTSYWQLQSRPFDRPADVSGFYPGETHQAALLKLRYALEHRLGAALVAGPSGLGKTLLVESLCQDLPPTYSPCVHVKFPQMPAAELLAYLAAELGDDEVGPQTMDQSLRRIERRLAENAKKDQHALLIIDEAHLLREPESLETIRLLINFAPAWTVLLVGQPGLLPVLQRTPELEERMAVKCVLQHFSLEDTVSYIGHRMHVAGAGDIDSIFAADALARIHELTHGIPRRIDRLCDLALLIGFAEGVSQLAAEHIDAVSAELVTSGSPATRAA